MTSGSDKTDTRTGRRPDRAAFIIAIGLAAFGAVLLWDALAIQTGGGYAGVGPAAMPKLVGGVLIGLGVLTALSGWRAGAQDVPSQRLGPVGWLVGGLAVQIALLQPLGFSIATALLFACGAAAFGEKRFHISLPAGFVLAFAVYGVFDMLLRLNLPAGLPERLIYGG
jgi:putative tricarboxylic transport membrane protein